MNLFKNRVIIKDKFYDGKYIRPDLAAKYEFDGKVCAFTGYRLRKITEYSQKDAIYAAIKARLRKEILRAIDNGYRNFITGMALGVDTWAAEAVLQMKSELDKKGTIIRLFAAIPFEEQEKRWSEADKRCYRRILKKCENVFVVSDLPRNEAYLKRNDFMAQRADLLIAVYDGKPGGTAYTIAAAIGSGADIRMIDPESAVLIK